MALRSTNNAEEAFAARNKCVIVATSVLELGILELARHVLETRLCDPLAMRDALCRPVRFVQLSSRMPT